MENEKPDQPAEEPKTEREKKIAEFQKRAKEAKTAAGRRHWADRIKTLLGFDLSASRKTRWIVKHETNRHERRKAAAKKRKGIE